MKVVFLKHDGRCRWLETRVLSKLFPQMAEDSKDPQKQKKYLIIDWVSNDNGKVGLDLDWLSSIGVPTVENYRALPEGNDYAVVNTGYDSIVSEEKILKERGVEIIDMPCPYVRKLRNILEAVSSDYQYVLLCEPNHIIIKNFESIFPEDLIFVQMDNFKARIMRKENGKPLRLLPYVTFLPSHIQQIRNFIDQSFPERNNEVFKTSCMWIKSPVSPIVEIEKLPKKLIENIKTAALISTPGSLNKSLVSLMETLSKRKLEVEIVSSIEEYQDFETRHMDETILFVRSPIPNEAEKPIMEYIGQTLAA